MGVIFNRNSSELLFMLGSSIDYYYRNPSRDLLHQPFILGPSASKIRFFKKALNKSKIFCKKSENEIIFSRSSLDSPSLRKSFQIIYFIRTFVIGQSELKEII